jgi:hypothetical protein
MEKYNKAEYDKKFNKKPSQRKKRAELNRYNRKNGTYGNGDGLDASHKNGKIIGLEPQSKNRGRAEKSRLPGKNKQKNKYKSLYGDMLA